MTQHEEIQHIENGSGVFIKIIGGMFLLEFFLLPIALSIIVIRVAAGMMEPSWLGLLGVGFIAFLLLSFVQWVLFGWKIAQTIIHTLLSTVYAVIAYSIAAKATGSYELARIVEIQETELTIIYPRDTTSLAVSIGIGLLFFLLSMWIRYRKWS